MDPPRDRTCFECAPPRVFKYPYRLRRHQSAHRAHSERCFPCSQCDKRFKTSETCQTHMRFQHRDAYPHRCPVCSKGFQSRRKMTAHHSAHGGDDGAAQAAASAPLGIAMERVLDSVAQAAVSTNAQHLGDTCSVCNAPTSRDGAAVLVCSSCPRRVHWTCMGLAAAPGHPLPLPLCAICLQTRGLPPAACAKAAMARVMAEACVAQQGHSVSQVAPDGWCLVACVAEAVPGLGGRMELLLRALGAIRSKLDLTGLGEAEGAAVKREASRLLQLKQGALARKMETLWSTALWDHMPQALSRASGRALHIYEGNVRSGRVNRTVVDETAEARGAQGDPILLIRSCSEYGCAHYDLASVPLA